MHFTHAYIFIVRCVIARAQFLSGSRALAGGRMLLSFRVYQQINSPIKLQAPMTFSEQRAEQRRE